MTPRRKLTYDVSASAAQMIVTQLSGALIFYLLSDILSKQDIGLINWCLAILMIIYAVLGFGLDQLVVKKIAMGANPVTLLTSYLLHLLVTGTCFIVFVLLAWYFLPAASGMRVFALLGVSQLLLFCSLPFKQIASGFEKFRILFVMSVIANLTRILGLIALLVMKSISISSVVELYIFSSLLELIICILVYAFLMRIPFRFQWNLTKYTALLKESVPQLGIIFFNTALSRIDWVLLGLLSSVVMVAEYGFAYKFFELSTIPLLIFGQLLLPKISKEFNRNKGRLSDRDNKALIAFMKLEIKAAVFTILLIFICWTPVIGFITSGNYGRSNASVIFILSLCLPFLYINNVFWSVAFAQGKLKEILGIFFFSSCLNIGADLLLIPLFGGNGAAYGFVLAIGLQTGLYVRKTSMGGSKEVFQHLLMVGLMGFVAVGVAFCTPGGVAAKLPVGVGIFIVLLALTKKINFSDGFQLLNEAGT